ncbi:MAG: endolytic transglycosylase MltG [Treponema sp.]|jgi:UPF0755 protein|nr:endolytic transglycosylase MltG [Treponema sp.]
MFSCSGTTEKIETTQVFEVQKGESAQAVGKRLKENGLIKSQLLWYLMCRFDSTPIKAGTYRVPVDVSQRTIHTILTKVQQTKVTIPEGSTLNAIARLLASVQICTEEDFLKATRDTDLLAQYSILGTSFEGFLFPDTYFFSVPCDAQTVIHAMVNNFMEHFTQNIKPQERYEKVTIASLVEREYKIPEEAPIIAGVFYNRLAIGMPLQTDATIEYIITEIQGKPHPERILYSDLQIDNPYNTYRYKGLPPGPIGAPGDRALQAALHPQTHTYLYYRLIDPQAGRHRFSRTFNEHRGISP